MGFELWAVFVPTVACGLWAVSGPCGLSHRRLIRNAIRAFKNALWAFIKALLANFIAHNALIIAQCPGGVLKCLISKNKSLTGII